MMWSSLDKIVRSQLQNRRYTLHWYLEFLKYGSDCLREICQDDICVINSVTLTPNSYNAITIPSDCIDWIRIGLPNGQYIKPLTQTAGFNRQYNYQANGYPQKWPATPEGLSDLAYFGVPYLTYFVNQYNARGENIGGLYGYRSDGAPFIFQPMKERNEIQFDSSLAATSIVMDYVSDGRTSSSATMIDSYAESTIERYIDWAHSEYRRDIPSGEKERLWNKYVGQRVILRGRENPLTANDIVGIFRQNYFMSPKS